MSTPIYSLRLLMPFLVKEKKNNNIKRKTQINRPDALGRVFFLPRELERSGITSCIMLRVITPCHEIIPCQLIAFSCWTIVSDFDSMPNRFYTFIHSFIFAFTHSFYFKVAPHIVCWSLSNRLYFISLKIQKDFFFFFCTENDT